MAAKKEISGFIKLQIKGGQAKCSKNQAQRRRWKC